MRWEEQVFALFDDLEQQAAVAFERERAAEVADRARAEYRQVTLASRLMASLEAEVVLDVRGPGAVAGRLRRVGDGWCLVETPRSDWVVRTETVELVRGASERSRPESAWSVVHRLGLGSALRRLSEAGERCVLHAVSGARTEGVLLRVGADFVEVGRGEPVRGRTPEVALVPFAGLAAVQSEQRGAV